MPSRP
jgi:hypothetical protein